MGFEEGGDVRVGKPHYCKVAAEEQRGEEPVVEPAEAVGGEDVFNGGDGTGVVRCWCPRCAGGWGKGGLEVVFTCVVVLHL